MKCKFRKGQIVEFAYGNEYEGANRYKIISKYVCLEGGPRYDITNGVVKHTGVPQKALYQKAS